MEDETDIIMATISTTCQQLWEVVDDTLRRWRLHQSWMATRRYIHRHPLASLLIFVMVTLCAIPVMCFVTFTLCTLAVTFTSFLFIEGFLITCGGMLLGGALFVAGAVAVLACILAMSLYLTLTASRRVAATIIYSLNASRLRTPKADLKVLEDLGADQQSPLVANEVVSLSPCH